MNLTKRYARKDIQNVVWNLSDFEAAMLTRL